MQSMRAPIALAAMLLLVGLAGLATAAVADPLSWSAGTVSVLGSEATVGISLDAVSATLLTFIAGLAFITATYSRRNLRGQARLARFSALHIAATLSLALLVTGASLPLLALGWTMSGLAIAGLVAHRDTPAARRAAAAVRRALLLGDALLWTAVVVASLALPSLDRGALAASAAAADGAVVTGIALLLALAALIRSAMLPAHRWLYETAEAPSPVSAMLHAGVVNAVGLLGVLVWPLFAASAAARGLLILAGLATAVALTVAMRYRADVKGRLAASTSAQMGYLAIQVGIGLPVAGMLHLIGHGSYKAFLFLRAGGAVSRSRHRLAPTARALRPAAVIGALVVAASGVGLGLTVWASVPTADLLPIAAAAGAASVAAYAVLEPGRGLRSLVAVGPIVGSLVAVTGLLAGYLVLLDGWLSAFPGFADAAEAWSQSALIAWFVLLAAGLALALRLPRALDAGRYAALRARIGAESLPLGYRVPRRSVVAAPRAAAGGPVPMVEAAVAAALPIVGPAWPLRTAVAANPLAGLTDLHVGDAGVVARRSWGARTLPRREAFHDAFATGRITQADLRAAVSHAPGVPADHAPDLVVQALLALRDTPDPIEPLLRSEVAMSLNAMPRHAISSLNDAVAQPSVTRTLTEEWDARSFGGGPDLTQIADAHGAAWLLDLLPADSASTEPGQLWRAWRGRVATPGLDRRLGVPGFGAAVMALPEDPVLALGVLLRAVPASDHVAYLGRLLARSPGWTSHLAWRAYSGSADLRADLLAVRAAYDVLLAGAVAPMPAHSAGAAPVRATHSLIVAVAQVLHTLGYDRAAVAELSTGELHGTAVLAAALAGPVGDGIWQSAFEQRYRNRVLDRIAARAAEGPQQAVQPEAHIAMCIDVRSERFRRHLEAEPSIATYGFAGFFGLAIAHQPSAGPASDQCPVLLRPSTTVAEELSGLPKLRAVSRLLGSGALSASSAPAAPFALAEAAAPVTGPLALAQTLAPRAWRRARDWALGPAVVGLRGHLAVDEAMPLDQRIDAAYAFLHSIGQHALHGSLLVVAGHAATVENNAYAAAYDCGACGGNGGYINARVMAHLLNEPAVREGLAARGVQVDDLLVAVPAVHLTTTDELVIDDADVPDGAAAAVAVFRAAAHYAQVASATERVATLPAGRTDNPLGDVARRAADWAEATPEWGLAGNALFVAGPRWMTRGLNLRGRSFLHSYDPALDTDLRVLESILTAPMVVAHWINSQYYASSVDPERMGAGDKTTHNIVGDMAVLSGAHGDLRVGLPWQSLFSADPATGRPGVGHEPMRLQVVLYATAGAVLEVLAQHPEVARLVTGEWLSLAVVDPTDAAVLRLSPQLRWEAWDTDPVTLGETSAALSVGVPATGFPVGAPRRDSSGTGGTMRP